MNCIGERRENKLYFKRYCKVIQKKFKENGKKKRN